MGTKSCYIRNVFNCIRKQNFRHDIQNILSYFVENNIINEIIVCNCIIDSQYSYQIRQTLSSTNANYYQSHCMKLKSVQIPMRLNYIKTNICVLSHGSKADQLLVWKLLILSEEISSWGKVSLPADWNGLPWLFRGNKWRRTQSF